MALAVSRADSGMMTTQRAPRQRFLLPSRRHVLSSGSFTVVVPKQTAQSLTTDNFTALTAVRPIAHQ